MWAGAAAPVVHSMGTYHTVESGEHLSSIVKKCGFADYHTIWDHPNNAELKKKCQNPNVLFPGLKVDGICGPKTQAKLKQVHGC